MRMIQKATFDIVLIGGGIVGLWALNRLQNLGYSVVLLESQALGAGQTIKSQGIIHGGIKYALTGFLNKSAQSIATMPKRWHECLQGTGEIDLSSVNILSKDQLLWSTGRLTSEVTTFFASKALKSRVQSLENKDYPSVLQNPAFKGRVYRLEEIVLDVPSLIKTLASPYTQYQFKIDAEQGCHIQHDGNTIQSITLRRPVSTSASFVSDNVSDAFDASSFELQITAKRYVFCAGEGNASLLEMIHSPLKMQRRPLHMVIVRLPEKYSFYAHCLDNGANPRITITTHTNAHGEGIWYLGGQIAEDGINRSELEQCQFAKAELNNLFPWLEWENAEFKSFFINRAEGQATDGKRPDSFFLQPYGNAFAAWPTKLALTPLLCDELIASLKHEHIEPSMNITENLSILEAWEKPNLAKPIWDVLFS